MGDIRRIMQAVQDTPWAIHPTKLAQIGSILLTRAEAGSFPTASEVQAADAAQGARQVQSQGAVAVIPLHGTISKRMGMLEAMSGGASLEAFRESFDAALADSAVSAIVLDVDSPGGSVYGVDEVATHIFQNRGTKRIIAVANGICASAACYIAMAAGEFVVTPSSEVGSIGVYTVHFDFSGQLEQEGIRPTIIKAGEFKAEGNPYEPMGEPAQAHVQELVNDYMAQFERSVARSRGVPIATVREQFGQGRTFTARRALRRGMVDRIATLETTIQDAARGRKLPSGASAQVQVPGGIMGAIQGLQAAVQEVTTPLAADAADAVDPPDFNELSNVLTRACELAACEADLSTAAAGGAAPETIVAPTEPAPVAMEETVDPKTDAAAHSGAATTVSVEDAIQAERERAAAIRKLGAQHGVATPKVEAWVAQGATLADVNKAILDDITARATAQVPTPSAGRIQVGADREALRPFASFGDQLQAIALAANPGGQVDKRLLRLNQEWAGLNPEAAAGMGSHTGRPSDAGFVVQEDVADGIVTKMWDEGRVLSRTNRVPIGANSNALVRNVLKENSRKDGFRYGGVRVYRAAEADTVAPSNPKLDQQRTELEKLMGIYYATEETLQDATALTVEAERGFRRELTFVAENEVFRGTGAGQMLGFLNSNALVTVPKESAQAAGTITVDNVSNMLARLPASSFQSAAWFINVSTWPQLIQMQIGTIPVFVPGGNIAGAPFGTLFGIPIIPVEYCAPLGSVGDILLVDLAEYTTIDKRGVRWAESIHVRFIYDESTFKITYRINGQPDWPEAVEPFQGINKISPFVALEERS